MAEAFLGEIRMFGFNFAPNGWMQCNGQLVSIAQYSAVFALLGTYYGGNGTTTFGLPDLRGRVPLSQGQGPGLSSYVMGQVVGTETVLLQPTEIPAHNHSLAVPASTAVGTSLTPSGNYPAMVPRGATPPYVAGTNATMGAGTSGLSGGGQPHANLQPSLCVGFCICMAGIFPSRN
jgi:microcystin-dependent protein